MLIILMWSAARTPVLAPFLAIPPLVTLLRMRWRERDATRLRLKLFKAQNNMMAHAEVRSEEGTPRAHTFACVCAVRSP